MTMFRDASWMAVLALVSVGLWTLRVALTAGGRRLPGAAVAAVEASVFALVFGSLVSSLDRPARVAGYALGVALGTLLGISADKRLSRGRSEVRVMVDAADAALLDGLRRRGWPAAAVHADGVAGRVCVVFVAVDDRCLDSLLADVGRLAPTAAWTVLRLHGAQAPSVEDWIAGAGAVPACAARRG